MTERTSSHALIKENIIFGPSFFTSPIRALSFSFDIIALRFYILYTLAKFADLNPIFNIITHIVKKIKSFY